MFSKLALYRDQFLSWFDGLAGTTRSRVVLAIVVSIIHLGLFARAGHVRLDLPFNSAPGERPYYSDPDAPSVMGFPRQPHHWSRLIVSRWDSEHYVGFAVRGLSACPTDGKPGQVEDFKYLQCGLGWLPAYGSIGGLLSKITTIPEDYSLVGLSVLCTILVNLLWTSAPFVKRLGKREALGTLIAFNAFPTAFYMTTPYTEAATLMLMLAGFVALANDRWVLSGFLVGASTALRASAVAGSFGFGFASLVAAYKRRKSGDPKWWKALLGIPLCGWSMALQMLILKLVVGDSLAFLRARNAFGDDHNFLRIFDTEFYLKAFTSQHMDGVMLVGSFAIVALGIKEVVKKLGAAESVYLIVSSIVSLALAIAAVHEYWGLNRYLLLCPITFCCAGVLLRKHPVAFILWCVLSAMIYWHVEMCSYISHGNPQVCPCLGRFEFGMPFQS